MPLRDHFHPPLSSKRPWDAVHGGWPMEIVRDLFAILPPGYQAEPAIHLDSPLEVDIATYENDVREGENRDEGGVATLAALAPTLTVEADLSNQDQYEILIYNVEFERELVAAIEIVSPSNKDRPRKRRLFVSKMASLLQRGVCVSIVDLVSNLRSNLYDELLEVIGQGNPVVNAHSPTMYSATLRARGTTKGPALVDTWFYPMEVGQVLPILPIWLSSVRHVMLPLESSYEETCRLLRIG